MVTVPLSLQTWKHNTSEEQEPGLCLTCPPNTWCLSFSGVGMSLADTAGNTQVSLVALCWVCGSLSWVLLYNSLPSSEFAGSCALYTDFIFQSKLSFGLQVPYVAFKWSALWQRCGTGPGHAANAAAWVQRVRGSLLAPGIENLFISSKRQ